MKFIFFLLILLLLILFIKNKRESFSNKMIIGSVTTSEYDFGLLKQGQFLIEKEIRPVIIEYTYGEEGKGEQGKVRTFGFEVEKIEEILPEAVKTINTVPPHLAVDYNSLIGLLIEAVKELNEKVDNLSK